MCYCAFAFTKSNFFYVKQMCCKIELINLKNILKGFRELDRQRRYMLSSTHYIHFSESLLLRGSLCHGLPSPESPLTLASSESHRDLSVSHPDTDLWLDQRLITSYSCTGIVGGQKRMHPWSMGPCNQCQCSDNMMPLWLKMEKKKSLSCFPQSQDQNLPRPQRIQS